MDLQPTARTHPKIPKAEDTHTLCSKTRKLHKKRVKKGQEVMTTIDSCQGELSGDDGKEGWTILGLQKCSCHRGRECMQEWLGSHLAEEIR